MNSCPCCSETFAASSAAERPRLRAAQAARTTRASSALPGSSATDNEQRCQVLTIGHSTRPIEVFVALLVAHGVTQLVDVRTVPRSRHNPQFNAEKLSASLADAGIGYAHAEGLGGFRHTSPLSENGGWRNLSFRGYADYMQTTDFDADLTGLIALAQEERVVLMCAEAVPWRCHRSLIADALSVRDVTTCEIVGMTRLQRHRMTPFARVDGDRITYPPEPVVDDDSL
jgi:uncharacterized protein (DUF488 family)